ncbi:Sec-independent protein translocase protein TatB [Devosia sp.]|uniref:Sec-independent protein translocase protein TatB n=1 Tax=Devosia sp. TaxID=1871048 RepID=UPI00326568C8
MLGFGWTEMLVIGVVALIVIGPKDLPVVMARVGKIVGQIRRMGSEFQREINKTTGLNEIRNLRSSITEPLRKTTEEIRKEFNTLTSTGVQPSGVIKPTNPKVESVVDEIKAAAGIAAPVAAATVASPVMAAKPKRAAKAKAVPASTVTTTELQPVSATVPAPVLAARPAARKAAAPITPAKSVKAPAKKAVDMAPAAAKPAPKKAAAPVATAAVKKPAAKKPVAKKPDVKTGDA